MIVKIANEEQLRRNELFSFHCSRCLYTKTCEGSKVKKLDEPLVRFCRQEPCCAKARAKLSAGRSRHLRLE